ESAVLHAEKPVLKALESCTHRCDEVPADDKTDGATAVTGAVAVELHATDGVATEATLEVAAEAGLEVDVASGDAGVTDRPKRANADNRAKKHGHADGSLYREWVDNQPTVFTGYEELASDAKVIGLVRDGEKVTSAGQGEQIEVI